MKRPVVRAVAITLCLVVFALAAHAQTSPQSAARWQALDAYIQTQGLARPKAGFEIASKRTVRTIGERCGPKLFCPR